MNLFQKITLKLKNPEAYKNKVFLAKVKNIQHPALNITDKEDYHFKHSGNAGDLIYAIPAMLALSNGKRIHLHLNLYQKGHYGNSPHPLGGVMLNDKMLEMLRPLMMSQPGFATVDQYTGQAIDYDLDMVRQYPLYLNRGNIIRWYFLAFATNYPLHQPWLFAQPDATAEQYIIVARSQRYRAPGISYSFLQQYPNVYFIGVEVEFTDMQQMVPNIRHLKVNDFLQMAQLIAGCKLFIGNQSFPFSLAEALKVNRLLEVYFQSPNVSVAGNGGYDFCFQPQFESLVQKLFS